MAERLFPERAPVLGSGLGPERRTAGPRPTRPRAPAGRRVRSPADRTGSRLTTTGGNRIFRAGAASLSIDPPLGLPMVGVVRRDWTARGRIGRLEASALALEADGETVVLCGVDTLAIQAPEIDELRRRIAAETGAALPGILVNFSHTHHAPPGGRTVYGSFGEPVPEPDAATLAYIELPPHAGRGGLPPGLRAARARLGALGPRLLRPQHQPSRAGPGRDGPPARMARAGHARPVGSRAPGRAPRRDAPSQRWSRTAVTR